MRTAKKILLILAILVILIIICLVALPFFIDPNDYKEEISSTVEQTTGRQLTLEGDIELSVFPWIALKLGPMSLSNAEGFKADRFAQVDTVEVQIKLLPLLKKELEMDTIILDGLKLNLETAKNGRTNWDDLIEKTDKSQQQEPDASASDDDSTEAKPALAAVNIAGVQISNANIVWADASKDQNYQLKNFNLKTDPIKSGKPTDLAMSFDIDSNKPQLTANISLDSQVTVDTEKQHFTISDLLLQIKAQLKDPKLPVQTAELSLKSQIEADLQNQTATISEMVLNAQDLTLNADIKAEQILSENPRYTGALQIKPFNLRKLANELGVTLPKTADNSTLELVELKTGLEGDINSVNAKQLALTLDQSQLSGQLAINNFAKPAFNFKLKLNEIDADRYLPPPAKEDKSGAAPTPATSNGAAELPVDALRQINAKGSIDIGKLKISGIRSQNIHVTINAAGGLVKLKPTRADLYQGHYEGATTLDARGKTLILDINEKISQVQSEPLLTDMTGSAQISGTVNSDARLTATGNNVDQIKRTLSGKGKFSFKNGAIKGINIGESIRKAKAALKGQTLPESNEPTQTDFADLSGSFTITKGLVNNPDLSLKSPLLRINGAGQASLPKETIDYNVKAAIVATSKGQGGKELEDLKGLSIPIKITGTFSKPKPTVDLGSLIKDKTKQEIEDKIEDKIKEELGDEGLGGVLGGFLGGSSDKDKSEAPAQ